MGSRGTVVLLCVSIVSRHTFTQRDTAVMIREARPCLCVPSFLTRTLREARPWRYERHGCTCSRGTVVRLCSKCFRWHVHSERHGREASGGTVLHAAEARSCLCVPNVSADTFTQRDTAVKLVEARFHGKHRHGHASVFQMLSLARSLREPHVHSERHSHFFATWKMRSKSVALLLNCFYCNY